MNLNFPPTMNAKSFLQTHWQKKPLLIRNALPDLDLPVDGDDLAGMALEPTVESRIILERDGIGPWQTEQGPFDTARFASLPPSHWTLLIQDAEKHAPEVTRLLEPFAFLPHWRLDDVMISYAADQGSVGPHVDDYDVFLIQAAGRRRWLIEEHGRSEAEYIPGLDLRILPDFNPTQDWVLEPGDLLYLPPHVPHWGVAQGDNCITCSVGYRSPTLSEMVSAWCDHAVQTRVPHERYRDSTLAPQRISSELDAQIISAIQAEFTSYLQANRTDFVRWFGCFVSEPKEHLLLDPCDEPLNCTTFFDRWSTHGRIERNGWARFLCYLVGEAECYLFVNGEAFVLSGEQRQIVELICNSRTLDYASCSGLFTEKPGRSLLAELYNKGYLLFP